MTQALVLVVEDTLQTRILIEEVINYVLPEVRVEGKRDPLAALDHIKKERPTLIITDLRMPAMDGYTFIAKLDADEDTCTIPIIVMSAFADKDEDIIIQRKLKDMGIKRHIPIMTKPFNIQEFRLVVGTLLRINSPSDQPPTQG